MSRKKIVVFASGSGSNFEEIVKKSKSNYIEADVPFLISDKASAGAIKRAIRLGVVPIVINWKNREEAEEKALKILKIIKPDLIVLQDLCAYYLQGSFQNGNTKS